MGVFDPTRKNKKKRREVLIFFKKKLKHFDFSERRKVPHQIKRYPHMISIQGDSFNYLILPFRKRLAEGGKNSFREDLFILYARLLIHYKKNA